MSLIFLGTVLLFFPLLFSCDILRNGVFEVAGWNPGSGYHDPASAANVTLSFSLEPDRNSVERSFSLSEDGTVLPGHFSWQGSRMIFSPAAPLIQNRDYLIILKTDAQDKRGLSLERQFEAAFSTRNGSGRPVLLTSVPLDGGIITGERDTVELFFSVPMNRSSLQGLSFSPSVSGVWSLEDSGKMAVFTPSENWLTGKSYRLNAGSSLKNNLELEAGRDYVLHFSAGADRSSPELISAAALDSGGNSVMILEGDNGMVTENKHWEWNYRLGLTFSEPVETASVTTALRSDPSLGMILETAPGYADKLVYRFTDPPAHDSSYTITLEKSVKDRAGNTMEERIRWRIRSDGTLSRPPVLKAMRFPKVPALAGTRDLLSYTTENLFADFPLEEKNYTFDKEVPAWIELYFETSPGASIDSLSLMEKFKWTATNGAVHFSPRFVVVSDFTVTEPAPGWENFCRVEIRGMIINHPYMGMVTIETGAGLADTLGNRSSAAFRFLLLK